MEKQAKALISLAWKGKCYVLFARNPDTIKTWDVLIFLRHGISDPA